MEPYRYHVYVCDQRKPEGAPACTARGSEQVLETLRQAVAERGLGGSVQITTCGSLGLCDRGPNLVVYPEGIWYCGVTPADVAELVEQHFVQGRPLQRLAQHDVAALRGVIEENRGRMLAAQRARDAAGAIPDDLQQTVRGFQESRIVLTAVELDLFSAVGEGAAAPAIAERLHTDQRATEALLNALAAIGLLRKERGVFCNSPQAARFLASGSRDDARAALMHTVHLWERWSTLTACVRAGTAVAHEPIEERGETWTTAFIAAMHRNAAGRAPQVVQAVGAEGARRLLDVGGGSGAYAIAFARAVPALQAVVLDLAPVLEIARRHIEEAELTARVATRGGDLRRDELGAGEHDLVLVSAICHMLSPDENLDLLRRCVCALAPGGRVVIQDFIMNADKTAPRSGAAFALNMLVGTTSGSAYSEDEYAAWLRAAGCADVRRVPLPGPTALMVGRSPDRLIA